MMLEPAQPELYVNFRRMIVHILVYSERRWLRNSGLATFLIPRPYFWNSILYLGSGLNSLQRSYQTPILGISNELHTKDYTK